MARRRSLLSQGGSRPPTPDPVVPDELVAPEVPDGLAPMSTPDPVAADRQNLADTLVAFAPASEERADPLAVPEPTAAKEAAAAAEEPAAVEEPAPEEPATDVSEAETLPVDIAGVPASAMPTMPPAPRHEVDPELAGLDTPIRPDRLPGAFETPSGGDWYLKTGQPAPRRPEPGGSSESAPIRTAKSRAPIGALVAALGVAGLVICGGMLWLLS